MPCKNRIFTSVYLLYPISRHSYFGAADLNTQCRISLKQNTPKAQPRHREIKDFMQQKSLVTKLQTIRQWVLLKPVEYSHNQLRATLAISPKEIETHWTGGLVDVKRGLSLLQPGIKTLAFQHVSSPSLT